MNARAIDYCCRTAGNSTRCNRCQRHCDLSCAEAANCRIRNISCRTIAAGCLQVIVFYGACRDVARVRKGRAPCHRHVAVGKGCSLRCASRTARRGNLRKSTRRATARCRSAIRVRADIMPSAGSQRRGAENAYIRALRGAECRAAGNLETRRCVKSCERSYVWSRSTERARRSPVAAFQQVRVEIHNFEVAVDDKRRQACFGDKHLPAENAVRGVEAIRECRRARERRASRKRRAAAPTAGDCATTAERVRTQRSKAHVQIYRA